MKELTLLQDFLPDCFNQAKNLEEFVKDILKEKHKQKIKTQIRKAAEYKYQCDGSWSKLWLLIEKQFHQ